MFKVLAAIAALPLALGLINSFEDGGDLTTIAQNISNTAETDSGKAFELGGGRTVDDAFNSGAFTYSGGRF